MSTFALQQQPLLVPLSGYQPLESDLPTFELAHDRAKVRHPQSKAFCWPLSASLASLSHNAVVHESIVAIPLCEVLSSCTWCMIQWINWRIGASYQTFRLIHLGDSAEIGPSRTFERHADYSRYKGFAKNQISRSAHQCNAINTILYPPDGGCAQREILKWKGSGLGKE